MSCSGVYSLCFQGVIRRPLAGDLLVDQILAQFKREIKHEITPAFQVASKKAVDPGHAPNFSKKNESGASKSYMSYQISRTINDYKEAVCQVYESEYDER